MSRDSQYSLFDTAPEPKRPSVVGSTPTTEEVRSLADRMPRSIRLGTSSWSFPGWQGIVYDRKATQSHLAKHGLSACAKHPLLRAVGIDRTYYAPLTANDFREYASSVDDGFRFLVKALAQVTDPHVRDAGGRVGKENPLFLDAKFAVEEVVAPLVEGLGSRAGPLVFQFPPVGDALTRDPSRFVDLLAGFLAQLPRGPWYAVEIRDRELLCAEYVAALASAGASHCINIHPRMPAPRRQAEVAEEAVRDRLAIRWMLHSGLHYDEARDRYSPFNRLVDPDPASRSIIADLAVRTMRRRGETVIIANNKAEGCAPLTLVELAGEIVARLDAHGDSSGDETGQDHRPKKN